MKEQIEIFKNEEFGEVRTILIDGEPWFVGKDVATVLGYTRPQKAIKDLVEIYEQKTLTYKACPDLGSLLWSGNDYSDKTVITESGLYSLILSSKLPSAKKFKRWITTDVLPSIRKHGVYAIDELIANPDLAISALNALKEEREKTKLLESELDYSKEWYSIKRVAAINHVTWDCFDWRKLKDKSNAIGVPPKKIFDANYGEVNTYHMKAWEEAYPEYEL